MYFASTLDVAKPFNSLATQKLKLIWKNQN